MSQSEVERDLEYAEYLEQRGYGVWHPGVTELQRLVRPKTLRRPSHSSTTPIVTLPPASQQAAIAALAVELSKVLNGRHSLYLALSGTLLRRGLDPDILTSLVGSVARQACDAKVTKRMADAVSTARAWRKGGRVTGYSTLRAGWPSVADAVNAHFPRPTTDVENRVQTGLSTSTPQPVLALSAAEQVVSMTSRAACENPKLPRLLVSPPGVGKTRQAVEFALNHDGKVAIVHGTNKVAIEHFALAELRAKGRSQRRFGALSVIDADGSPACKKASVAGILQGGGLSVQQRLCIRCQHRGDCTARDGVEGVRDADLAFFNHAMLGAAVEHVGSHGLLVVDENLAAFVHQALSVVDLETTERLLRAYQFPTALAHPCAPLLRLLIAEADAVEGGERLGSKLRTVVASVTERDHLDLAVAAGALGHFEAGELDGFDKPSPVAVPQLSGNLADDAVALFLAALAQWPNHAAPPTTASFARQIGSRLGTGGADEVATAARTLVALKHAFTGQSLGRSVATWQVSESTARVQVTYENPSLASALRRLGPTVFLDATADERALRHLAGRPLNVERHGVVDAAPVTRLILANAKGAKRHLGPKRSANWPALGAALASALAQHCASKARNILVITHKVCAVALRSFRAADVPHVRLQELLKQREAAGLRLVVGHFGDVRGRNEFDGLTWKEIDVLITVGDPWPDIGQIEAENRLLDLSADEGSQRLQELVAAELGQAHGRLRAPRQLKPTAAIHVGSVVPAGWTISNTTVEKPPAGRRPGVTAMTRAELRVLVGLAGSRRALAVAGGVSESSIRKYLQGRAIPAAFATQAREKFGQSSRRADKDQFERELDPTTR